MRRRGSAARTAVRCVDVEGGTVNRLRDALAPIPSAQAVADGDACAQGKGSAGARAWRIDRAGGKAFGFNTTLAPVVDLALPESAEVLGTRCPAADPNDVVDLCARVSRRAGGARSGRLRKAFSGLGGGTRDTHFETPAIGRNWEEIWSEDLVPYRELHDEMPMIMMNHAAYPRTPGKKRPASASNFWITAVLRKRIGYRGIILSDDLEMGGILKFAGRRGGGGGDPRGIGPAGDLPQRGADSARL